MTSVTTAKPVSARASASSCKALLLHALEAVWAGAGFERSAAQAGGAGFLHDVGDVEDLSLALHGTRTGHDPELVIAHLQIAPASTTVGSFLTSVLAIL